MKGYIPCNLSLKSSRYLHKYYYLLTIIYKRSALDLRYSDSGFVPLFSKILHDVFGGNYKKYLNHLIAVGVIETDNSYLIGSKSKGYKLTDQYKDQDIKTVEIHDKYIKMNYEYFIAQTRKAYFGPSHLFLYDCLRKTTIRSEKANEYIFNNYLPGFKRNRFLLSVELLRQKDFFFSVDKTAGRVHTNITSLKRELRDFLVYGDQSLVEIDINNSQPFLFNILINEYYRRSINTRIHNNNYYNIINPYVTNKESDCLLYENLTSSGSFYDYLMENFGIEEDRVKFKKRYFSEIFFCKETPFFHSELNSQFNSLFPTVSKIILFYKKIDYRNLAITLQRVEADIMINIIARKLAEDNIFMLTIHDSILTTPNNVERVKSVILSEFEKQYKLIPTLKIKGGK